MNRILRHPLFIVSIILAMICIFANAASAQSLTIATGAAGDKPGTYSIVFRSIAAACKNELMLVEKPSSGSIENLDLLINNQVNGATIQIDVLFSQAMTQDLSGYKTLVNLFPEEVHVVAPAEAKQAAGFWNKTKGLVGKADRIEFNTVSDLAGYRIGAAGGSVRTANLIRLQSQISFVVEEYKNNVDLKAALDAGQVEAAVFVGGQPLPLIAGLGQEYKLVPFSEATQGALKNVYKPAVLNYTKMGKGGAGVRSVATEAALVVQTYKSPKMVAALSTFRRCVMDNVSMLAETVGSHPALKRIADDQIANEASRGKWAWLALPDAPAATPAPAPARPATARKP